jgi:glycerophosphoryl diester phosphodiesterase
MHYYQYGCRVFEIDVQIFNNPNNLKYQNDNSDRLIVYHDELSINNDERSELVKQKDIIMLDDFLRFIPDNITLNIEIKDYSDSNKFYKPDDESLFLNCSCKICMEANPNNSCKIQKINLVNQLVDLLVKYNKKTYIISSFDKYICNNKNILDKLNSITNNIIYLVGELENYDKTYKKICIHKKFLDILNYSNHDLIYVYDVENDNLDELKLEYPYIKGWILDF